VWRVKSNPGAHEREHVSASRLAVVAGVSGSFRTPSMIATNIDMNEMSHCAQAAVPHVAVRHRMEDI